MIEGYLVILNNASMRKYRRHKEVIWMTYCQNFCQIGKLKNIDKPKWKAIWILEYRIMQGKIIQRQIRLYIYKRVKTIGGIGDCYGKEIRKFKKNDSMW